MANKKAGANDKALKAKKKQQRDAAQEAEAKSLVAQAKSEYKVPPPESLLFLTDLIIGPRPAKEAAKAKSGYKWSILLTTLLTL